MVTGKEYATQARSKQYDNIPYSKMDCQMFVEEVLADCGVRNSDGKRYNWKGSNDMWRNALKWKGTIQDALDKFGHIPDGAWLFIVKNDGGETERGYHDGQGNATHVAIYCDPDSSTPVRDSTRSTKTKRDGVGYRSINAFTHVGLPTVIDYSQKGNDIASILSEMTACIERLSILTNELKGDIITHGC